MRGHNLGTVALGFRKSEQAGASRTAGLFNTRVPRACVGLLQRLAREENQLEVKECV